MSDGPIKTNSGTTFARVIYEWGTLAFGTLAAGCLAYWIVSITSSIADLKPIQPRFRFVVSASRGSLVVSSRIDETVKVLEADAYYYGTSMFRPRYPPLTSKVVKVLDDDAYYYSIRSSGNPPLTSNHGLSVPGFRYRLLRFAGDELADWALEMSLLIPFVVFGALTGVCFYRYRAPQRIARDLQRLRLLHHRDGRRLIIGSVLTQGRQRARVSAMLVEPGAKLPPR